MTGSRRHLWIAPSTGPNGLEWEAVVPAVDREEALEKAGHQAAWAFAVQSGGEPDVDDVDVREPIQVDDDQAQVYEVSWQSRIASAEEVLEHERMRRRLIDQIDPQDRAVDVGMDLNQQFGIPDPIDEWEPFSDRVWARSEAEAIRLTSAGFGTETDLCRDLMFDHVAPLKSIAATVDLFERGYGAERPKSVKEMQAELATAVEAVEHIRERLQQLPGRQVEQLQSLDDQLAEISELDRQRPGSAPAHFREAVAEMNGERRQSLTATRDAVAEAVTSISGRSLDETVRLLDGFTAEHDYEVEHADHLRSSIAEHAIDGPPQWIVERLGQQPPSTDGAELWKSAVRTAVKAQLQIDPGAPLDHGLPDDPTAEQRPHVNRAMQALEPVAELPVVVLGR